MAGVYICIMCKFVGMLKKNINFVFSFFSNFVFMLITGIRHRVKLELDAQRTDIFKIYLLHYLQMFAILGIIFPVLIGIDYFSSPVEKKEAVTNKYYSPQTSTQIYYYLYTETIRFRSDYNLYEKVYIGDTITFVYTPIFKLYTDVFYGEGIYLYHSSIDTVYGWLLVVVATTFVLSSVFLLKFLNRKKKYNT